MLASPPPPHPTPPTSFVCSYCNDENKNMSLRICSWIYTTIKQAETVKSVAAKLQIQPRDLIQINTRFQVALKSTTKFLTGTELRIPCTSSPAAPVSCVRNLISPATVPSYATHSATKRKRKDAAAVQMYKIGEEVQSFWNNKWYDAIVLSPPCPRTYFLWEVQYVVDRTFDQCSVDAIRRRTTTTKKTKKKEMKQSESRELLKVSKSLADWALDPSSTGDDLACTTPELFAMVAAAESAAAAATAVAAHSAGDAVLLATVPSLEMYERIRSRLVYEKNHVRERECAVPR